MVDKIAPHTSRTSKLRRSVWREAVLRWLLRRLTYGTLVLHEGDSSVTFGQGAPVFHVTVHDLRTYSALVKCGSVGFGESYTEGWWDVEDLTGFVQFVIRNMAPLLHRLDLVANWLAPLRNRTQWLTRQNKVKDKENILAHYDLGNSFYQVMLDPTMMYSCAYFASPEVTLEEASKAKLDLLCQKLALSPDDHLVEIGTGWGGLAVHAATNYGCRVTSVTISDAQHAYATALVERLGLSDRVTILNQDYRDLTGTYDKLVSVEMIEAIGWRQLETYFRTCAALIKPDGLMALQAIVIEDIAYERTKHSQDFIKDMIFPGGFLPSVQAIHETASAVSDLRLIDVQDIGRHYAETLRRWRENLADRHDAYDALGLGDKFQRMWNLYLQYCEAAFLERHVSDVHMIFAKQDWRDQTFD